MAEKKINGRTFKVVPLPAGEALELYAETLRIAGHGAGRLPALLLGADGTSEASALKDLALLLAMSDVLNGAGSVPIRDLVKRLVDLDLDFTGQLGDIIPVVKFVLQEQFSDFFTASGASGILGMLKGGSPSTRSAA